MTRLSDVLDELGLVGEPALGGQLIKLQGERCAVYVVEAQWGGGYFAWCDDPDEREVLFYQDPVEAISTGLSRAALPPKWQDKPAK